MISSQEDRLKRIFGESNVRRSKKTLPDRVIMIDNQGTEELCTHTGFDILDGKENVPSNWWKVFVDVSGHYHLVK